MKSVFFFSRYFLRFMRSFKIFSKYVLVHHFTIFKMHFRAVYVKHECMMFQNDLDRWQVVKADIFFLKLDFYMMLLA